MSTTTVRHLNLPHEWPWPWPHFAPKEIACKHCGEMFYDIESMAALERLRTAWGKPIIINSGHRCAAHNKASNGVADSMHLRVAFDCACPAKDQAAFVKAARAAGFRGIGRYATFVHIDMGEKREWKD